MASPKSAKNPNRTTRKQADKNKAAARAERAAAARREMEARERKRRLFMIGGVVAVMVLVVALGVLVYRGTQTEVDAPAAGSDNGLTIGPASGAEHEVVIYEDFLCPVCGELEAQTRDDLAQLAADGQITVEYRPFVLLDRFGDYSARSLNAFAVVLDAAGPEVAKTFHDELFENQPAETGPFPSDDDLVDLAVEAGATESEVADGITGMEQQDFVDRATREAQQAGVNATPTILVDGEQFQDGRTIDELAGNLVSAVS